MNDDDDDDGIDADDDNDDDSDDEDDDDMMMMISSHNSSFSRNLAGGHDSGSTPAWNTYKQQLRKYSMLQHYKGNIAWHQVAQVHRIMGGIKRSRHG